VGLGLTNECNLSCPHCYRDADDVRRIGLAEVQEVLRSIPVGSVNLGYAENGLHPELPQIVDWLAEQDCKLTFTSNSLTVQVMSDAMLQKFTDVELSLDFPDAARQDDWRSAGNYQDVLDATRRCKALGVNVTILAVMMRHNYTDLIDIGKVAFAEDAGFRVNVYQASKTDIYALTYEEYWEGFQRLLREFALVTTTEPVLAAALGLDDFQGCGCGKSTVRVMPTGAITPCTYWPIPDTHLSELRDLGEGVMNTPSFEAIREVPQACGGCPFEQSCHGGCGGRRALSSALNEPDHYCMLLSDKKWDLPLRRVAGARDMPKSRSACTTIFAP
jgi:radical SAM protein with 4Fe4S-binding SPASM domain